MEKRDRVRLLASIILAGFLAAVIFHGTLGLLFNADYPRNTFLFRPDDRFNDFYNPLRGSFDLDPYNPDRIGYIGGYLPFGYFMTYLFSVVQPPELSLSLFLGGFLLFLGAYVASSLAGSHVPLPPKPRLSMLGYAACIAFLTYPTFFIVDRANFDVVVFIFVALFALLYQRGHVVLAVVVLTPAIAMKGYPAILLTLPLLDRRFKELVLACLLAGLLTFGALALFQDGLLIELQKMLVSFQRASGIGFGSGALIRFNSSLYTALLFLLGKIEPNVAISPKFNIVYLAGAATTWGVCTLAMWKWKAPFWSRLVVVIGQMILLPQSSGDYRLVMLYPPLLAFLNSSAPVRMDRLITTLFGLLMIPKAYAILESDVNIGLLLNPLLVGCLILATLAAVSMGSGPAAPYPKPSGTVDVLGDGSAKT